MQNLLLLALFAFIADDADDHFRAQRYAEAAEAYRSKVESDPQDALAWYRLGFALHAQGLYWEALEAHEQAASFPGTTQPTASYNAACASAAVGEAEDAVLWLQKAVRVGFNNPAQMERDPDLDAIRGTEGFRKAFGDALRAQVFAPLRALPEGDPRQFDFWIGEWDTDVWTPAATGNWVPSGRLTMKVLPVAGGSALVEWAEGNIGPNRTLGFSLRSFDPISNAWTLVLNWPSPGNPSFNTLYGGFRHGRGEFLTFPGGTPAARQQTRYSFSDAAEDRLRWDGANTKDGGKTWNTNLLFEFNRRPAGTEPLPNGPSRSTSHASDEAFREFDFLLGSWTGRRIDAEGNTLPLKVDVTSVMEGSAITVNRQVGAPQESEASASAFSIFCFEKNRGTWIRYGVEQGSPLISRHATTVRERELEWTYQAGPGISAPMTTLRVDRQPENETPDGTTLCVTCENAEGEALWHETWVRDS